MDQKTKKSAYVKIVEEPASKGLRFRYECESQGGDCFKQRVAQIDFTGKRELCCFPPESFVS